MFNFVKRIKKKILNERYVLALNTLAEQTKAANNIKIDGVQIFDKAMDTVYNSTHIGGGNHRLFDGGHTIVGAWKSTQLLHIPFNDRITGTTKALINDFVTDKGLPLLTISKDTYNSICETLPLPRNVIYDLFKLNIYDLLPIFKTIRYANFVVKNKTNYDTNINIIACTTAQVVGQSSVGAIISLTTSIVAVVKSILDHDYIAAGLAIPFGIGIGMLTILNPLIGIPCIFSLNWFSRFIRRKLS